MHKPARRAKRMRDGGRFFRTKDRQMGTDHRKAAQKGRRDRCVFTKSKGCTAWRHENSSRAASGKLQEVHRNVALRKNKAPRRGTRPEDVPLDQLLGFAMEDETAPFIPTTTAMVEAEMVEQPKEATKRKSRKRAAEPAKTETKQPAKKENKQTTKAEKPAEKAEPKAAKPKRTAKTAEAAQPYHRLTLPKNQEKKTSGRAKGKNAAPKPPVRIYFLGGLNEIGKNITLFECGEDTLYTI